ncbi:ExbD/TolR family protein [Cognatiyoonia sp. IB215182]|uniref:ExbD/TolR family protein n=1 Tax=Cognatiyoonia sp. IB215182 TaxID=3097353 RepID=UPI002A12C6B9|nr:biopolymer transporter ExbD [Cognatiyoonia sp. IB215182]MDX8355249.1 biopolymer transporter ExbD [Cognatiyoonia sp. IB215182]
MTSLIDVIFLLLLFFMLTSTFSRFGEIPITLGGRGAEPLPGDPVSLLVRITDTGPSLNGTDIAVRDLAAAILERAESAPQVLVTTTTDASAQALAETLFALRGLPDAQIVVLE